jgi:serine/threonine protein phosphatase PrpC
MNSDMPSRPDETPVTNPTFLSESLPIERVSPPFEGATGPSPKTLCPQCGAARDGNQTFCSDCGFIFGDQASQSTTAVPDALVAGRFRLLELLAERDSVTRFRADDEGAGGEPIPVIVVRQPAPPGPTETPTGRESKSGSAFEFDLPESIVEQPTVEIPDPADPNGWPGVNWEQGVLLRAAHLSLPRLIDVFTEDGFSYLVEEAPSGVSLWDAWDRNDVTNRDRFGWLVQVAEALDRLHFAGAIVEGLRPEMIVVSPSGLAILANLADLLPIPMPGDVPLRGGFSTAPELLLNPGEVDARADLYTFGSLLYALLLGRELSDLDFTLTSVPKPLLERLPDSNPFLVRLLARTFVREPSLRFPTEDGALIDPTGFRELIAALQACRRNLDRARIDVAAWSTVGMVRSGNEDAVTIYHSADAHLDNADEAALVLLADGMGGMASGEVAAALALQTLRNYLLSYPPFDSGPPSTPIPEYSIHPAEVQSLPELIEPTGEVEAPPPSPLFQLLTTDTESPERTADVHAERIAAALREANRRVFDASRAHHGARGMGCTAEAVLIDGGTAVVGHVGDSRVYRYRKGRLLQVTRDHTVVGRLVEVGQITEEEAEVHPRRSELHQAIGGRPDVYPDVYSVTLKPGDWLIVCSDGLSNQVSSESIQGVLKECRNAEHAARRLVNMALTEGAQDNVTVAVVRIS